MKYNAWTNIKIVIGVVLTVLGLVELFSKGSYETLLVACIFLLDCRISVLEEFMDDFTMEAKNESNGK